MNFKALILMDSDGQHDPAELGLFFDALVSSKADMVLGDRMQNPLGMPWLRRMTNYWMSALISTLIGRRVGDSQCGYRAMTTDALRRMRLSSRHFEIESEMLLEAGRLKLDVISVPIRCVYEGQSSHIHPCRDTLRFIWFLLRRLAARGRRESQ